MICLSSGRMTSGYEPVESLMDTWGFKSLRPDHFEEHMIMKVERRSVGSYEIGFESLSLVVLDVRAGWILE
jgi:hypothetical protein